MLPLLWLTGSTMAAGSLDDRLRSPQTWCAAAAELAASASEEALLPLVAVYDANAEADRLCLLDAIVALAADDAPLRLLQRPDPDARRTALRVMELSPDARWLGPLRLAVGAPETEALALAALVAQVRSPAWEALMIELLSAPSVAVRAEAVRVLAGRRSARAALEARLDQEPDAALRAQITGALAP